LISVARGGEQPNGRSELPAPNFNASVIGFKSAASNLIESDGNGLIDVFVNDRNRQEIERIPRRTSFPPSFPDGESFPPGLDYSGDIVGFASAARNLVRNDLNMQTDAFAYDRNERSTEILTLVLDEVEEGALGGRVPDLPISVSADGNLMVFTSSSDFFVDNARNEVSDVFIYDRSTDQIELISVATLGGGGPRSGNDLSANGSISADGNFVVFCSEASNLTAGTPEDFAGIFLRDRGAGTTSQIAVLQQRRCLQREFTPAVNENGNTIAFTSDLQLDENDDNGVADVFVWHAGSLTRVSQAPGGGAADGPSSFASISANGMFVAFQSQASNLIADDGNGSADVFVVDLADGRIARASETAAGDDFPEPSGAPRISPDGVTVVFQSDAQLAPEDQNPFTDIYAVINVLSFTPTPTPTTPTETPTQGPPTSTPVETATSNGGGTPTPSPTFGDFGTLTPVVTATPTTGNGGGTPTPTSTRPGGGGGGGGGGCSCRIDPDTGRPADPAPWQALLLPVALWLWRRRSATGS
jgi:Tol biopolymer transport system component